MQISRSTVHQFEQLHNDLTSLEDVLLCVSKDSKTNDGKAPDLLQEDLLSPSRL
jgi:hypothetical protein